MLTDDEKEFVLENWHEGACNNNGAAGAHFTPLNMAWDFEFDVPGMKIIDLCAGIGCLAFVVSQRRKHNRESRDLPYSITCVEINPEYVEVGKKIVPEATWICGDATDPALINSLGYFDCAMANPPFGKRVKTNHAAPIYSGPDFEFRIIDLASQIADYGTFIIPQMSAPFQYSGQIGNKFEEPAVYVRFKTETGITLDGGVGVDTAYYKDDWKGVAPICEIVTADFAECRQEVRVSFDDVSTPDPSTIAPSHTAVQLALF